MKKLLITLSAISMVSASFATTAFTLTSNYKSGFKRSIQKVITTTNISAEAQILSSNQKVIENYKSESKIVNGVERSTTSSNINYKYLIKNLSSQKMVDFLPKSDWVKNLNADKSWDRNLIMDHQLLKSYGDAWSSDESKLTSNEIKFEDGLKQGASSTMEIVSLVSSLVGILFGSDFNVGQAQILYQNTDLIFNMLGDSLNTESLEKIYEKVSQLPSKSELDEFIFNPFTDHLGEKVNDIMMQIGQKLWSILMPKTSIVGVEDEVTDLNGHLFVKDSLSVMLEKIGSVLNYLFLLVWYIQEFDDIDKITPQNLTNVLNRSVTNDDVKNFDEVNISKITKILMNFLNPGYNFQGARNLVNILLAVPEKTNDFDPGSNIILTPLFNHMREKLNPSTYSSISPSVINTSIDNQMSLPQIGGINLDDVNWIKLLNDILEWVKTPNSLPNNVVKMITDSIKMLIELVQSGKLNDTYSLIEFVLNEALFKSLTDDDKNPLIIGDVLYLLASSKNKSLSKENKIDLTGFSYISSISGVPNDLFYTLYDGKMLKSLFQLINAFKPNTISQPVIDLVPDLRSALNLKMGDLFDFLGLNYDNNFQFLYGLRNLKFEDIIESIDKYFKPKDGELNQNSYFDYGSLRNIITSLFDEQEVTIDEKVEKLNNLQVLIKALIAGIENKKIKIGEQQVDNPKNAIVVALGMKVDGSGFIKNGIFETISKAYGHNLVDENGAIYDDPKKAENTVKLVSSLIATSDWFINTSEKQYRDDNFRDFVNQQNWYTKFLYEKNYENIFDDAEVVYELRYKIDKYRVNELYEVKLTRSKMNVEAQYGNNNFIVSNIRRVN